MAHRNRHIFINNNNNMIVVTNIIVELVLRRCAKGRDEVEGDGKLYLGF